VQLGSFVPADSATFRIASNLFSRVGTGDNIEGNASSFELEVSSSLLLDSRNHHPFTTGEFVK
jgi:DNA mismatch repair ATPase MutS